MNKLLSIIIPSYNMEKYLPKCLGSLVQCDAKLLDCVDVIVVNDGSQDRTSAIGHDFEVRYPSVIRVIDKPNGHYGSCVNAGLLTAHGVYVKILDADDSFDSNLFAAYLNFLVEKVDREWNCAPDVIWNDFVFEDGNGCAIKTIRRNLAPRKLFDVEDSAVDLHGVYMHQVAYKTQNLRAMSYHQDEGICYTDNEWCHSPVLRVRKVAYCDIPVYRYLVGRDGQSVAAEVMKKNLWMMGKVALRMASDYMQCGVASQKIREYLRDFSLTVIANVYVQAVLRIHTPSQDEQLCSFEEKLQAVSPELYTLIEKRVRMRSTGYQYIKAWRKHKNSNCLSLKIYRLFLNVVLTRWHSSGINA